MGVQEAGSSLPGVDGTDRRQELVCGLACVAQSSPEVGTDSWDEVAQPHVHEGYTVRRAKSVRALLEVLDLVGDGVGSLENPYCDERDVVTKSLFNTATVPVSDGAVFVLFKNQRPVSFIGVIGKWDQSAVAYIGCSPHAQGNIGILFEVVDEWAKKNRYYKIVLHTQLSKAVAERYYNKFGYKLTAVTQVLSV